MNLLLSIYLHLPFYCPLPASSFTRSASDIETGLLFFVPTLLLDAAIMIPDFSSTPDEVRRCPFLLVLLSS